MGLCVYAFLPLEGGDKDPPIAYSLMIRITCTVKLGYFAVNNTLLFDCPCPSVVYHQTIHHENSNYKLFLDLGMD